MCFKSTVCDYFDDNTHIATDSQGIQILCSLIWSSSVCIYIIVIQHFLIFLARRERGLDTQMSDMPRPGQTGMEKNATSTKMDITTNNNDRSGMKDLKKKLRKTDWKAAVGPYPVVSPGTREASFVHAISSAGVAHAVTRSCSSGELENCGCDRSLRGMSPEGFQVNVLFYIKMAQSLHMIIHFSVVRMFRQCWLRSYFLSHICGCTRQTKK